MVGVFTHRRLDWERRNRVVTKKTWNELRESGLLWWLNMILHTFGWAIVLEIEDDAVIEAYPARVKFRGFSGDINSGGYEKVTKYLKDNIEILDQET